MGLRPRFSFLIFRPLAIEKGLAVIAVLLLFGFSLQPVAAEDKGIIPLTQLDAGHTLTAGTYLLTDDVSVPSGDVFVIGGNDVTINLNGHTLTNAASASGSHVINCTNFTNFKIRNGRVVGGYHSIYLEASDADFLVEDVNISGFSNAGIYMYDSGATSYSRVVIRNNTMTGPGATAPSGACVIGFYANGGLVENNQLNQCRGGIYVAYSMNTFVRGNTATASLYGIGLQGDYSMKITGNSSTGNSYGIYMPSVQASEISGNTLSGSSQYAIYATGSNYNSFVDNAGSGTGGTMMYIQGSGNTLLRNVASCNDPQNGITLDGSNNIIRKNRTPGSCGINMTGGNNIDAGGNY